MVAPSAASSLFPAVRSIPRQRPYPEMFFVLKSLSLHIFTARQLPCPSHFLLTALREFSSFDSPTCMNWSFSGHHLRLLHVTSCIASHLPLRHCCLHNDLDVRTLPEYDRSYVGRSHTAIFRCSANVEILESTPLH